MKRCAIYARFSSDLQRATSIDDQVAVARRYAGQQPDWHVLDDHIYKDEAVSGVSLVGRPGVQALMIDLARQPPPFDVLLVDDSSRIARDLEEALHFMKLIRDCRVRVVYISQQIDSDHEQAETMLAVHGIVDGLYLREMAKKIRRGLAGQHGRGLATGGRTFGYRTVRVDDPSGKLDRTGQPAAQGWRIEKDEAQAAVVRMIFTRCIAGVGIGTIVEELNRARTPGPRGGMWGYGAVQRVLRNERYTGLQIWGQRKFERRPGTNRKVARPQPRSAWLETARPELEIITTHLWEQAQQRRAAVAGLARRQPGSNLLRGRQQARHLFTAVMKCAGCGGPIAIVGGGHGSSRYGCRKSWRDGTTICRNRLTVRAVVADSVLLSGLQDQLTAPATIAYLTQAVSARVATVLDGQPKRRRMLESERTKTERRLKNLVTTLEDDGPSPSVRQAAIRDREADLVRIERELAVEPVALQKKLTVLPSWVARQVGDVVGLLQDAPEKAREGFRRLGLSFMVTPVYDEGHPFLRAVGSANVLEGTFGGEFDFSATGRSHPRSAR